MSLLKKPLRVLAKGATEAAGLFKMRNGRAVALLTLVVGLLFVTMMSGSEPRRVGDGGEYVAMSRAISRGASPNFTQDERADMGRYLPTLGESFNVTFVAGMIPRDDGSIEMPHFWMYSLLVAPLYRVTDALSVNPNWAFAAFNLGILLVAVAILARRFSLPAVLMTITPLFWFIDKAHTEIFTFALLAIGLAWMEKRPGWSLVVIALASTQNLPIALLLVPITLYQVATRRELLRSKPYWTQLIGAGALSVLHPLYYSATIGVLTPQQNNGGTAFGVPTFRKFLAPLTDLNVGILANAWWLSIFLAVAVVLCFRNNAWRRFLSLKAAVLVVCMAILLLSFAQTTNVNAGANPGFSRYGIWLLPFLLLFLNYGLSMLRSDWSKGVVVAGALIAVVVAMFVYQPDQPESYVTPTPIAAWTWDHQPDLDNPLAEVFYERVAHVDGAITRSVAAAGCRKVLLLNAIWPDGCPPVTVPKKCRGLETLCYANKTDSKYIFRKTS